MFEFARRPIVPSQPCLRCGSVRTVVGTMISPDGTARFLPGGMRWWSFWSGAPLVPDSVQSCLDCGCLVGGVDPALLRSRIERAGSEELRETLRRPGRDGR